MHQKIMIWLQSQQVYQFVWKQIQQQLQLTSNMKSLANDRRITDARSEDAVFDYKGVNTAAQRKLEQLIEANAQCEKSAALLQTEISKLTKEGEDLDQEIASKKIQLQGLKNEMGEQEEEKEDDEHQGEMGDWITHVQNYTGCPPQIIEGLCSLEYEGSPDEQEICLSCYQEMKTGAQCKYLPCCHLFHSECIDNHLKVNTLCPACGELISM